MTGARPAVLACVTSAWFTAGLGAQQAVAPPTLVQVSLVEAVRRGNVAGALVAAQLACSEAMPRIEDLEAALV